MCIDLRSLVRSCDCINSRDRLVSSQGCCSEMLSIGKGATVFIFCFGRRAGKRSGRGVKGRGDWHICTGNGTGARREMVDVIREAALIPGSGSEQHSPTYSLIIQSNISVPLTATPALHLSVSLPRNFLHASQQNLTNLNLSSMRLHSTKSIVFPDSISISFGLAAQL